jgi:hypothetical protein
VHNLVFVGFILIFLFSFLGNSTRSSMDTLHAEVSILERQASSFIATRESLYSRTKADLHLGVLE